MMAFGNSAAGNMLEQFFIKFRVDMTDLQNGLKIIKSQFTTFNDNIRNSSTELRRLGTSISLVAGALKGLEVVATKTFADFQQAMANTASVLGAGQEELRKLTELAREMGTTTIYNATEAGNAMYYLASAGYNATEVMDSLNGILTLAASTQYDLIDTTRIVVGVLRAFQFEASAATRVANVFAAVISKSQATMYKLGESMKYVAPFAASLGLSLEETSAVLGTLYNSGLHAFQAGTYLRQILIRLQDPTNEAKEALRRLHLAVTDVNPAFNSLTDIVKAFEKAGAGAADKGADLQKIFGARGITAFQILIKQGSGAVEELEGKITDTNKAAEMMAIQLDTLKNATRLLVNNLKDLAISFGTGIYPIIRRVVDGLKLLVKSYNNLSDSTKNLISQVAFFTSTFALLGGAMLLVLSKLPMLITGLRALSTVVGLSLGSISVFLAALGAIGYILFRNATAYEREREAIKKNIQQYESLVDNKIGDLRTSRALAEQYKATAEATNKSWNQSDKLQKIHEKLRKQYPDIITGETDYAKANAEVARVIVVANKALDHYYDLKLKIMRLKLTNELNDLRRDMRELIDEAQNFQDLNFWDKHKVYFPPGVTRQVVSAFGEMGDAIVKSGKKVKEAENQYTAVVDVEKLRENLKVWMKFDNAPKLFAAATKKANEELTRLRANQGHLTVAEEQTMYALEELVPIYDEASKLVQKTLENKADQLRIEEQISKLNKEDLAKGGRKARPCPKGQYMDENGNCVKPNIEDEIDALRRRNRILRDLRKAEAKAELELFKSNQDQIAMYGELGLADQKERLKREYEYKKDMLEESRKDAVYQAEKEGIAEKTINESYKRQATILEKQYLLDRQKLDEEFNWKQQENAVKAGDEQIKIIQQITDRYGKELERRANIEFELMSENRELGGYAGAIDAYKKYLEDKMVLEEEWSDRYMSMQNDLYNLEQKIRKQNLEKIKEYSDIVTSAMSAGIAATFNNWIISSRRAKNEMDYLWLQIESAALRALQNILTSKITQAFENLLLDIFSFITGGVGGILQPVLNVPGASPITAPDYGGIGLVGKVTAPETVNAPAATPISKIESLTGTGGMNINLTLVNPIVDDKRFWTKMFSDHIEPAAKTYNEKRLGKK